jgi:hypothetical protein
MMARFAEVGLQAGSSVTVVAQMSITRNRIAAPKIAIRVISGAKLLGWPEAF